MTSNANVQFSFQIPALGRRALALIRELGSGIHSAMAAGRKEAAELPEDPGLLRQVWTLGSAEAGIGTLFYGLPPGERQIFIRRYLYLDTTQEIADALGLSPRKTAEILRRLRLQVHSRLEGCPLPDGN